MLPFVLIIALLLIIIFERTRYYEVSYVDNNLEKTERDLDEFFLKFILKMNSQRKLRNYSLDISTIRAQQLITEKMILTAAYERSLKIDALEQLQYRILKSRMLPDEVVEKYWPLVLKEDSIYFDRHEDKYWLKAPTSDTGHFITVEQIIYSNIQEGTDIWYRVKYTCMSLSKSNGESGARIVLAKAEWLNDIRSDKNTVRFINGVLKPFWTIEESASEELAETVKESLYDELEDYLYYRIRFLVDKERIQRERKRQPKKFPIRMFIRFHLDDIEYNVDYYTKHRYKDYQPVLFSNFMEYVDKLTIQLTEQLKKDELRNVISNKAVAKYRKKF